MRCTEKARKIAKFYAAIIPQALVNTSYMSGKSVSVDLGTQASQEIEKIIPRAFKKGNNLHNEYMTILRRMLLIIATCSKLSHVSLKNKQLYVSYAKIYIYIFFLGLLTQHCLLSLKILFIIGLFLLYILD